MLYAVARETGDGGMDAGFGPGERGPHNGQAAAELDSLLRDGLVSDAQGGVALAPAGRAAARDALGGADEHARAAMRGTGSSSTAWRTSSS